MSDTSPPSSFPEISLTDLGNVLSTTIKRDDSSKKICFLCLLLTYTEKEQQNIAFNSESTSGKTWIPLEEIKYFPPEDVITIGGASKTAFIHKSGTYDKKTRIKRIDFEKKICLFLDQPHDELLKTLRPFLSHDQKEIHFMVTDKTSKGRIETKHVVLIGFATVIFCSVAALREDQEKTRMLMLSGETDEAKVGEALVLEAYMLGLRDKFEKEIEANPERKKLFERISAIKALNVRNVDVPTYEKVLEDFKQKRKHLIPRHLRDLVRLFALIKGSALLNAWTRNQTTNQDGSLTIEANQTDEDNAFALYEEIVESNEIGLTPEQLNIFKTCIEPHLLAQDKVTESELDYSDIAEEYLTHFHRPLSERRLKGDLIPTYKNAGFIEEKESLSAKRKTVFGRGAYRLETEQQEQRTLFSQQ